MPPSHSQSVQQIFFIGALLVVSLLADFALDDCVKEDERRQIQIDTRPDSESVSEVAKPSMEGDNIYCIHIVMYLNDSIDETSYYCQSHGFSFAHNFDNSVEKNHLL